MDAFHSRGACAADVVRRRRRSPMASACTTRDRGPPTGRRSSCCTATPTRRSSFSRVMPLLPPELRVIALDLRGHGRFGRPANGYRIGDLAADVIQDDGRCSSVPSAIDRRPLDGQFRRAGDRRARARRVTEARAARVRDRRRQCRHVDELRAAVDSLTDPVDARLRARVSVQHDAQPVPEAFMDAAIANSRRMPAARLENRSSQGLIEYRPEVPRPNVRTLVSAARATRSSPSSEQMALARSIRSARIAADRRRRSHAALGAARRRFVDALLDFVQVTVPAGADFWHWRWPLADRAHPESRAFPDHSPPRAITRRKSCTVRHFSFPDR